MSSLPESWSRVLSLSVQARLAVIPPSLQSLARDAVLRQLLSLHGDSQKSQVKPLVERLEGEITKPVKELLQTSYSAKEVIQSAGAA